MRKSYIWIILLGIVFLISAGLWQKKLNYAGAERFLKRNSYAFQSAISFFLANKNNTLKLDIPFHRQERALSCEIASLKMALNYYGVAVEENDLYFDLEFSTFESRDTKNNIWGDPDVGFVGDIDGKIPNGGYGVYEKPIADISSKYRNSKALINASLSEILNEIKENHPVIVWGTVSSGKDISWKTRDGKQIKAVFGEHARVLAGFSGTIENPTYIYLVDPIYGNIRMSKKQFLNNWDTLDNRAVIVY
jgi:N-acetylmuramoyl-L-alanine amidase